MRLPVIIINDCWEYIIELELELEGLCTATPSPTHSLGNEPGTFEHPHVA